MCDKAVKSRQYAPIHYLYLKKKKKLQLCVCVIMSRNICQIKTKLLMLGTSGNK